MQILKKTFVVISIFVFTLFARGRLSFSDKANAQTTAGNTNQQGHSEFKQDVVRDKQEFKNFYNDVELGLQNLGTNPVAQSLGQEIQHEDYKSTWDEFGVNALIDGVTSPTEIDKNINQDILQNVQVEQNYDKQEAKYLEDSGVTPETIQTVEESGGSDVPPGELIDPNPSAEANPDISLSSSESDQQITSDEATSTENTSATTSEVTPIITETSMPPSEAGTLSDETIFDAILQGEQTNLSPTEPTPPSSEPFPSESSPTP